MIKQKIIFVYRQFTVKLWLICLVYSAERVTLFYGHITAAAHSRGVSLYLLIFSRRKSLKGGCSKEIRQIQIYPAMLLEYFVYS